ncbi:unnamed protein product [Dovyalis caffra]|uniref:Uncharacterized protein n=1 Tax=Dovyalis caffra TaxID=77055 RepID=A0AAV1SAG3_9ROSI|nr:unnamed protein product [Dovyalis caffra]
MMIHWSTSDLGFGLGLVRFRCEQSPVWMEIDVDGLITVEGDNSGLKSGWRLVSNNTFMGFNEARLARRSDCEVREVKRGWPTT